MLCIMPTPPTSAVRRALLAVSLSAASLAGACGRDITDADIQDISLTKVKALVDDPKSGVVLIDARAPQDYAAGHIPGARNLPLAAFSGREGDLDPSIASAKAIVVYGDNPGSPVARGTTKRLLASGYEGVVFFSGGLSEWKRGGFAVQTK